MIRGLADALLPVARKRIKEVYEAVQNDKKSVYAPLFKENKSNEIQIIEVYENYTTAFGMIVNQSGFQSAFAIYNEDKTNSEGSRSIVTRLLYEILSGLSGKIQEDNYPACHDKIIEGEHNSDNYEDLFKEASIALKRAIRTFEIVKK
ncbi:MAG: hypothetical protein LBS55_06390 [Prevotellaceae bacterium]|jgi:hypothetical protein|nr:hypothetical protein [Prevotellaceae bacterium]